MADSGSVADFRQHQPRCRMMRYAMSHAARYVCCRERAMLMLRRA